MPIMRRDKYSGAIIFDLTPDEEKLNSLQKTTQQLAEKIQKLEEKVQQQGGDK